MQYKALVIYIYLNQLHFFVINEYQPIEINTYKRIVQLLVFSIKASNIARDIPACTRNFLEVFYISNVLTA
jgi:hypothetical protein